MSKRLLSAICLFIVLFCPLVARAEMTVDLTVVGSSTSTATSATCGNASPSSNIAAGDPVIAAVFAHTTGVGTSGNTTVASVSDSDGNTWVRLAEYSTAVGGTNDYLVGLYLTVLAAQLATSDTVACNTGNGSSKRWRKWEQW